jgi:hypothetical protein
VLNDSEADGSDDAADDDDDDDNDDDDDDDDDDEEKAEEEDAPPCAPVATWRSATGVTRARKPNRERDMVLMLLKTRLLVKS